MEYCRLEINSNGDIITTDDTNQLESELRDLIQSDKKYGLLSPDSKGWITWQTYDYDSEITIDQVNYCIRIALTGWQHKVNAKFRPAKKGDDAILKIYFSDPQHDPNMTANTLAYHYYPFVREKRGICVINRDFYFTVDGKPVSLTIIDPKNYPKPTTRKGKTYDLDQVLRHEFGHGVFGLQHDKNEANVMSANYAKGAEFLTDRDVIRAAAKVGKKTLKSKILERWYRVKSEGYF